MLQGRMMVLGIKDALCISHARELQAVFAIDELGAKTTSIAKKIAVDLSIETIVNTFEFTVTLSRQGVATYCA